MTGNPSFVLRKLQDVVFEDRPIPESAFLFSPKCSRGPG